MRYLFIILLFVMLPLQVGLAAIGSGPSESDGFGTGASGNDGIGSGPSANTGCADGETGCLTNPLSNISSIPDFFRVLIEIILVFAIPFIVFFIIYAGFLYVTARGNAEKIQKAHAALLYALIGGMLILGANVLLDIITNTVDQIK